MNALSPAQQRILKIIHLVAAFVWLSCVLLLGLLPLLLGPGTSDEGVRMFMRVYHLVDIQVLSPAATVTVLTGLVYSALTPWGFARHRWIAIKWVVSLALVLWGTFHLGPSVKQLLAWSREAQGLATSPVLAAGLRLATRAAALNTALLVLLVVLSVLKPRPSRSR